MPSPLPVKADRDADKNLSPKNALAATQLLSNNGGRSGAMNPEPMTSVQVPASPGIQTPVKPCTPNINWPRPASQVKSADCRMTPQKSPLPAIQPGTPAKADLNWPSPHAENLVAA